jgi:hypothetical protein
MVPHSQEILPDEKRIRGLHIKEEVARNFDEVKNKIVIAIFLMAVIIGLGVIIVRNNNSPDLPSWVPRGTVEAPWFKMIKLAISNDGLNFVKINQTLVENGDLRTFVETLMAE